MDITYIPMKKGYMYPVAIIDLYSRYVINWSVSNSIDANWCQGCLEEAIEPGILNRDQGSQLTSESFANYARNQEIKLSMDGKGRAIDNAFIERPWRSVKYEKLYLYPPKEGADLYLFLAEHFNYYNMERRHPGIDDQLPGQLYFQHKTKAA